MKHLYIFLFFLFFYSYSKAQYNCSTVYFNYGPTGHRIHRQHQTCVDSIPMVSTSSLKINQSNSSSNTAPSQQGQPTASVYPNPVKDKLNITLPMAGYSSKNDIAVLAVIKLYDYSGHEVYSVTTVSNNVQIDMSEFKPGLYSLTIVCGSYNSKYIIIKE